MKRHTSRKLGDMLKDYFSDIGRSKGILAARVVRSWDETMEQNVANATTSKYYSNGTLYVTLSSSIVRSRLSAQKRQILYRLNAHLGGSVVKTIVLR